jgi:hypothetical protein
MERTKSALHPVWWNAASCLVAVGALASCMLYPRSSISRPPTAQQLAELVEPQPDIPARDLFHGAGGPALAPPAGAVSATSRRTAAAPARVSTSRTPTGGAGT